MAAVPTPPPPGAPISLTAGVPGYVVGGHPSRLLLVVAWSPPVAGVYLWPTQPSGVWGIGSVEGESCVRIHRSAYPGLCQADWYAVADQNCTLYVIDQALEDLPR